MGSWINPYDKSLVIASKVKILRNVKGINFTSILSKSEFEDISYLVLKELENIKILDDCYVIKLKDNKEKVIDYYRENFGKIEEFKNKEYMTFIKNKNEDFNILLNEEEHIGIECTNSGLSLRKSYSQVNKIDDLIESKIDYSFDADLGYLTSNIKNLGTTLRAKVLIHLPVLTLKNGIRKIKSDLKEEGISFKSVYSFANKDVGNIYEITNMRTAGISEEDILDSLISTTNKLILKEKIERDKISNDENIELKDNILRSLGILKNAYTIELGEALKYLSFIRLGIELGIIKDLDLEKVNFAMTEIQPVVVNSLLDKKRDVQTLKIERAKIIRNSLST